MIGMRTSLEHMAWSNQKIFTLIQQLPEDVYFKSATEGEWPVGKLLTHFLSAAEWYRYLLTGEEWTELSDVDEHSAANKSAAALAQLDEVLLTYANFPNSEITFLGDDGNHTTTSRELVLTQAAMHAAEHKGQLATILKIHGYHLDLDSLDVWSFALMTKNNGGI